MRRKDIRQPRLKNLVIDSFGQNLTPPDLEPDSAARLCEYTVRLWIMNLKPEIDLATSMLSSTDAVKYIHSALCVASS